MFSHKVMCRLVAGLGRPGLSILQSRDQRHGADRSGPLRSQAATQGERSTGHRRRRGGSGQL